MAELACYRKIHVCNYKDKFVVPKVTIIEAK